ncbi:unnamed protein product, partial [marine sediment metagenome]
VKKVSDWAGSASKKIDERTGGAWETASAPIKDAGYKAGEAIDKGVTAVKEWGKSVADKVTDAYDKAKDAVTEWGKGVVDRTKDYIADGGSEVDEAVRKNTKKAKDNLDRGGEVIDDIIDDGSEKAGSLIDKIGITLGVGMEAAWAALGGLPDLLTNFKADLVNWLTFDITEFNETMSKIRETTKLPEIPEHPAEWRK